MNDIAEPSASQTLSPRPRFRSAGRLAADCPSLRPPVIRGLLREGETTNLIAPPKTGKSWLATDAALSVATGRPWMGFQTTRGDVLVIDNELHPETANDRISTVAQAAGIPREEYAERLFVENLRGQLAPLSGMAEYFAAIDPGRFRLIVLDAWYRFLEPGADENSNAAATAMYNLLDRFAGRLRCSFLCIHHTSKGSQLGRGVTDVGAGAGAQSRAADTHAVIRPHEEPGCAVLEAVVRSAPPPSPICIRWVFPRWQPAPELDPKRLHGMKAERGEGQDKRAGVDAAVLEIVGQRQPVAHSLLIADVREATGCSNRTATEAVRLAFDRKVIATVSTSRNTSREYTLPGFSVCARTPHTPQGSAFTETHVPCVGARVRSHRGKTEAKPSPRAKADRKKGTD